MQYSVMPKQQHTFPNLTTEDRREASRTEIKLLTFRIRNQFPHTKVIYIQTTLAVMDIPLQDQADKISEDFNCRVDKDERRQVTCS